MIEGIIWAVAAGVMLGLYALPEKYTREFEYENTWGLFFLITMFIVPFIAAYLLLDGLKIFTLIDSDVLLKMAVASLLWGVGIIMWGKAINHIGLSLGFSIFIGTLILIGSLIPWFLDRSLPASNVLYTILGGLAVVLLGVIFNGKAGIEREKNDLNKDNNKGSMLSGILIAVIGGILATAFSYANSIGKQPFIEAAAICDLPEWKASIGVMNVIYLCGGIAAVFYFINALSKSGRWSLFSSPQLGVNLLLIVVMSILNYTASVTFSFAASELGPQAGGTVGYAIFNAMSVVTATSAGLIVGEWKDASSKAKQYLYLGLVSMVVGIVIISIGNGLGVN